MGESPEKGKSRVGRVILISPTHITVSGLSWKCGGFQKSEVGRVSRKRKVTSWESYSNITYPHNSFRVELEMWRFSGVGSWESLPKRESHELREFSEKGKSPVGRVTLISPTHIRVSGLT
ncbi:hypothetical protein [Arthrospira sp. PCC 8006]|uniref:hypothetical protein n=1 Tax=Arthrospira sp. PCC 8006 TaxID=1982224 RepID=UPI00396F289A